MNLLILLVWAWRSALPGWITTNVTDTTSSGALAAVGKFTYMANDSRRSIINTLNLGPATPVTGETAIPLVGGGGTTSAVAGFEPAVIKELRQVPIIEKDGSFVPRVYSLKLDPNRHPAKLQSRNIQPLWFRPAFRPPVDSLFIYNPSSYLEPTDGWLRSLLSHYACGATDQPFPERAWVNSQQSYEAEIALQQTEVEQGLIPKFNLPAESSLDISGRKLVQMGYTRSSSADTTYGQQNDDMQMKQELQVKVEGTIARKTKVYVDYDDTRENDSKNQIYVQYKGDPEELVEEAAFGDIVLSLPSTEFVSYSSSKAVFGAKLILRHGELRLWNIASIAKGENQTETFSGSSQFSSQTINDYAYTASRYYVVNDYRDPGDSYRYVFGRNREVYANPSTGSPEIAVFVCANGLAVPNMLTATAVRYDDIYDGPETVRSGGDSLTSGNWIRLTQQTDYTVDLENGVITINKTFTGVEPSAYNIALAFKIARPGGSYWYSVGYNSDETTINYNQLKLIKHPDLTGLDYQYYELKNVYALGGTSINPDSLVISLRDTNGDERDDSGTPYIQIYHLDGDGDGKVDSQYVDYTFGTLTFPDPLPFDHDIPPSIGGDDPYPPGQIDHQFEILVEYQAMLQTYILRPNIIEGSERVTINGVPMVRDIDYWIDYDSGYIEFLTEAASQSDADIRITYEYSPLFTSMQKTLAGSRLEWKHDEADKGGYTGIWGATFLGEWTSKPKGVQYTDIDASPTNQIIMDSDFTLTAKPEWMTEAAKLSPGVKTEDPSLAELKLEIAEGIRNPNNTGVARINDMESAYSVTSVSLSEPSWIPGSVPGADATINEASRSWQKIGNEQIYRRQINSGWGTDKVTVLNFGVLPRGPAAPSHIYDEMWGGIMTAVSRTGLDFTSHNYQYLEVLICPKNILASSNGILHIDVGVVSEDMDSSGELKTEDPDNDGRPETDEGITFDNTDATPPGHLINTISHEGIVDSDDLNRNGSLDVQQDYFEYDVDLGKIQLDNGYPDYRTAKYDITDASDPWPWYYLRIPLDFSTRRTGDYGNPDESRVKHVRMWLEAQDSDDFPYSADGGSELIIAQVQFNANTWDSPVVEPILGSNELVVETIDSFTDGDYVPRTTTTDPDTNLVNKESSLLLKYTYTNWADDGYPLPTPTGNSLVAALEPSEMLITDPKLIAKLREGGVLPYNASEPYGAHDGVLETEDINGNGMLDAGEDIGWTTYGLPGEFTGENNGALDAEDTIEGRVKSVKLTGADDYSDYRTISAWIYSYYAENDKAQFFIRFGSDEDNYFEYFQQIPSSQGWYEVRINLDSLQYLKKKAAESADQSKPIYNRQYGVFGDPSLLNIQMLEVGVRTQYPMVGKTPGQLWVNDITLQDPIKRMGVARKASGKVDFGGYLSITGQTRRRDQEFSSVGDLDTDMNTSTASSQVDGILDFGKYFEIPAKVKLPLGGGYSESEIFRQDRYNRSESVFTQGNTRSENKYASLGFSKPSCPTVTTKYALGTSTNDKYHRMAATDDYLATIDYNIPLRFFVMPKYASFYGKRLNTDVSYGRTSQYVSTPSRTSADEYRGTLQFEPITNLLFTPKYSWKQTMNRLVIPNQEQSMGETYNISSSYTGYGPAKPSTSYSNTYQEVVVTGTEKALDFSNSSNLNVQLATEPGNIMPLLSMWKTTMRFTPTYSLARSSSYRAGQLASGDLPRPSWEYRSGQLYLLPDFGKPRTSRMRYSWTLDSRVSPLEFLSGRKNIKREEWDWLDFSLAYGFAKDHATTGSVSDTVTVTWPDSSLRIQGKDYFPIFNQLVERSTVTLSYLRKTVDKRAVSSSVENRPGITWNADWSSELNTLTEYTFDTVSLKEADNPKYISRTETISPGFTIRYRLSPQASRSIPWLGSSLRLRNDLSLTASAKLVSLRNYPDVSLNYQDDSDRWTYQLSGNYYFTTALNMTVTATRTVFTNIDYPEKNNDATSIAASFEALF